MPRITITPEEFTLTKYDAARVIALATEVASAIGFPADVDVSIDVDEALPSPLTGSYSEIVDGRASLWFSGGSFESGRYQGELDEPVTKVELGAALLRAADRLGGGFDAAPAEDELSGAQRELWDVYAEGRLAHRDGFEVREPRRRYSFRLHSGFSDVADSIYQQLWNADGLTWADLLAMDEQLEPLRGHPRAKRGVPRRETLRRS